MPTSVAQSDTCTPSECAQVLRGLVQFLAQLDIFNNRLAKEAIRGLPILEKRGSVNWSPRQNKTKKQQQQKNTKKKKKQKKKHTKKQQQTNKKPRGIHVHVTSKKA